MVENNTGLCTGWSRQGYMYAICTVESSAYMANCDETESDRSLINSKNSDGPRTEPCGTPALIRRIEEEWPPCTTEIWHSLRKLESKFNSPEMPYDFNLWMSPLCQTLSKAFEMSRATSLASPCRSNTLFMCSWSGTGYHLLTVNVGCHTEHLSGGHVLWGNLLVTG